MAITYKIYTALKEHPTPDDFKERFDVSKEEYFALRAADRGAWGILPMTLCVIRTDNLNNFLSDFCCPTVVNCALKARKLAGQIILGIGSLFLDIITLPVRLITLLPRLAFAQTKENNPAYRFLMRHSAKPEMYKDANPIYCTAVETTDKTSKSSDGVFHFTPLPKALDEYGTFFLI